MAAAVPPCPRAPRSADSWAAGTAGRGAAAGRRSRRGPDAGRALVSPRFSPPLTCPRLPDLRYLSSVPVSRTVARPVQPERPPSLVRVAAGGVGRESRQTYGYILRPLRFGCAVAHPFTGPGDHGLPAPHVEHPARVLDPHASPQHQRVLVEARLLG